MLNESLIDIPTIVDTFKQFLQSRFAGIIKSAVKPLSNELAEIVDRDNPSVQKKLVIKDFKNIDSLSLLVTRSGQSEGNLLIDNDNVIVQITISDKIIRIIRDIDKAHQVIAYQHFKTHLRHTLEHELTHLAQYLRDKSRNINKSGMRFSGLSQKMPVDLSMAYSTNVDEYLKPNEFYPYLRDAVNRFKAMNDSFSVQSFRAYLQSDLFFQALFERNRKLWKKAIGIFYNELQKTELREVSGESRTSRSISDVIRDFPTRKDFEKAFIYQWNNAKNTKAIARSFGFSTHYARVVASDLRKKGYDLKSFGPGGVKPEMSDKDFIMLWNTSKSSAQVAFLAGYSLLGNGPNAVRRRATRLRKKGFKLKKFLGTRQEPPTEKFEKKISDDEFVQAWNDSTSNAEVAEKTGYSPKSISTKASRLRKRGYKLK